VIVIIAMVTRRRVANSTMPEVELPDEGGPDEGRPDDGTPGEGSLEEDVTSGP
jgi:hypothetical protein